MKSKLLTKAQTAGIIKQELKRNDFFLQVFLLTTIFLLIANLVLEDFLKITNLILVFVQGITLYLNYKSNQDRIKEFQVKYSEDSEWKN